MKDTAVRTYSQPYVVKISNTFLQREIALFYGEGGYSCSYTKSGIPAPSCTGISFSTDFGDIKTLTRDINSQDIVIGKVVIESANTTNAYQTMLVKYRNMFGDKRIYPIQANAPSQNQKNLGIAEIDTMFKMNKDFNLSFIIEAVSEMTIKLYPTSSKAKMPTQHLNTGNRGEMIKTIKIVK